MKGKNPYFIYILGLLPLIMVLGNSMLIPILPSMEIELNVTAVEAGWILSIFSVPAALVIPLVGFLSDRYGRKIIVLVSMVLVMVGSIVTVIAGKSAMISFNWILIGRMLQGMGAGGTAPLAMALIADIFEGKERSKNLGLLEVFNGVGKIISPLLGALTALFYWYTAFYFYFFIALLAFIGIFYFVPSQQGLIKEPIREYILKFFIVIKREAGWFVPIVFMGSLGLFLLFGLLVFLSFEIERIYHVDGIFKGIIFAIPLGILTIVSYWTGKRVGSDRDYMIKLLFVGSIMICFALLFLVFYHRFVGIVFGLTIASCGLGLILPTINTLITSSVSGRERGLVVSLYGMVRFLGVALGPVVYSIWMTNIVEMFIKSLLLMLGSSFWLFLSLRSRATSHAIEKR